MARRDGTAGYYAAFVALVAGLGIAASLVYLLIARPATRALGVEISEPTADDCPVGERAPVCYRFEVTNTGGEVGTFTCEAIAPADSAAVFQSGEPRTSLIIAASETESILIKVTPLETDTVRAPSLVCDLPA